MQGNKIIMKVFKAPIGVLEELAKGKVLSTILPDERPIRSFKASYQIHRCSLNGPVGLFVSKVREREAIVHRSEDSVLRNVGVILVGQRSTVSLQQSGIVVVDLGIVDEAVSIISKPVRLVLPMVIGLVVGLGREMNEQGNGEVPSVSFMVQILISYFIGEGPVTPRVTN